MKKKRFKKIFVVLSMFLLFFCLSGLSVTAAAAEGEQTGVVIAQAEQQPGAEKQEGAVTQEETEKSAQAETNLMQREDLGERAGINLFNGKVRLQITLTNITQFRTHYGSHDIGNGIGWLGLQTPPYDDNKYHDSYLGVFKTILSTEALIHWWESPNLVVNQECYFKGFYEAAPDMDKALGANMAPWARYTDYQTPRFHWDEWINELYFDIYTGPWNFRVGKQVVFWSETEMVQTVDKINPLDIRYGAMGIEPWDEVKMGLWMFRGFYNSNLPGDLIFEHIFIPGDPQYSLTPAEGSSWGGPALPSPDIGPGGIKQLLDDWWEHDRPKNFNFRWYQYAFRVRGNSSFNLGESLTLDWTLSMFNGFTHTPLVVRDLKRVNDTIGCLANNRGIYGEISTAPFSYLDEPFSYSHGEFENKQGNQWEPRRYKTVGASAQTYEPITGGVYRLELAYEIGRPYNSVPSKKMIEKWYGFADQPMAIRQAFVGPIIHRDSFNYGITIVRPVLWPWLQQQRWGSWASNAVFDLTLGFFQGYIIGSREMVDNIKRQYAQGHQHETNFTFMNQVKLIGPMDVYCITRALYNVVNWGYVSQALSFIATSHLSVDIGYTWFYAKDPKADPNGSAFAEDQDFTYIKMKYQF